MKISVPRTVDLSLIIVAEVSSTQNEVLILLLIELPSVFVLFANSISMFLSNSIFALYVKLKCDNLLYKATM